MHFIIAMIKFRCFVPKLCLITLPEQNKTTSIFPAVRVQDEIKSHARMYKMQISMCCFMSLTQSLSNMDPRDASASKK